MTNVPRAEILRVLRRVGMAATADELAPLLPETVDLERDRPMLAQHGVDRDDLVSRLGGSP
jgi:hypothetical protein